TLTAVCAHLLLQLVCAARCGAVTEERVLVARDSFLAHAAAIAPIDGARVAQQGVAGGLARRALEQGSTFAAAGAVGELGLVRAETLCIRAGDAGALAAHARAHAAAGLRKFQLVSWARQPVTAHPFGASPRLRTMSAAFSWRSNL